MLHSQWTIIPTEQETGYNEMNRFLGVDMYFHPALKDFTWIVRLDSDCELRQTISYNILTLMETNNRKVGYSMLGMPDWTISP
jgi:hypothetical protein